MEELKKHTNKNGCRWLCIDKNVFEEEEVDAIEIDIRGFTIFIHKRY